MSHRSLKRFFEKVFKSRKDTRDDSAFIGAQEISEDKIRPMDAANSDEAKSLRRAFNEVAKGHSRLGAIMAEMIEKRGYIIAAADLSGADMGTIREEPPAIVIAAHSLKSPLIRTDVMTTIVHEAVHLNQRDVKVYHKMDMQEMSLKSIQILGLAEEASAYAIEQLFEDELIDPNKVKTMSEAGYKRYLERVGYKYYRAFFKDRELVDSYNIATAQYVIEGLSDGYAPDPTRYDVTVKDLRELGRINDEINITKTTFWPGPDDRFCGNDDMKALYDVIEAIQTRQLRGHQAKATKRRIKKIHDDNNPFSGLLNVPIKFLHDEVSKAFEAAVIAKGVDNATPEDLTKGFLNAAKTVSKKYHAVKPLRHKPKI